VNRALTKKLIYVIAALTMLAMLIPAMAIPVSAGGSISMSLVYGNPPYAGDGTSVNGTIEGYNIQGSIVEVALPSGTSYWNLDNLTTGDGIAPAHWYPSSVTPGNVQSVQVQGTQGEATITANSTGAYVKKKWGLFNETVIQGAQTSSLTFNKTADAYYGTGNVTDTVYGTFLTDPHHVAQGAILNWFLLTGGADFSMAPGTTDELMNRATAAQDAQFTRFIDSTTPGFDPYNHISAGWDGTTKTTVSNSAGQSTVFLGSWWMETVKIVVIPSIPSDPNRTFIPEVTTYSFNTRQYELVPQVRWAGEKVVLEANFGVGTEGDVNFYLASNSVGSLEAIDDDSEQATVWAETTVNGTASAILYSPISGQADVIAALYAEGPTGPMLNQYAFRVYFLDFYSLNLSDVKGKRSEHYAGYWTEPENPFNKLFPLPADVTVNGTDTLYQTLNVSQDALERAYVRGWFMPNNYLGGASMRGATYVDINGNGGADMGDTYVPAGHYVLPDDWAALTGMAPGDTSDNWKQGYLHWDIMDSPNPAEDSIASINDPQGPFKTNMGTGTLVAPKNTVGPFAPGIEKMTVSGWMIENPMIDGYMIEGTNPAQYPRQINTVVPNGKLNAWDCPMPAAKVVFVINSGAGYFKDAAKTDVYQVHSGANYILTSPFYTTLIPAHQYIPVTNGDGSGGYLWNSFDGIHGPYPFWKIVNTPPGNKTAEDAAHPTKVEVYSDNHGEAMVWLNGDWNLNLTPWMENGIDVKSGQTIANSIVQAEASYPYVENPKRIYSNTVEKVWTWGGMVLGLEKEPNMYRGGTVVGDPSWYRMVLATGTLPDRSTWEGPVGQESADSNKRMIWIWVCDRDGLQIDAIGTQIEWRVSDQGAIANTTSPFISSFNKTTQNIAIENGFLPGTKRLAVASNPLSYHNDDWSIGYAKTVPVANFNMADPDNPSAIYNPVAELFTKFYGTQVNPSTGMYLDPNDFSVAAIEILPDSTNSSVEVNVIIDTPEEAGQMLRVVNLDFTAKEKMDDPLVFGDANADGTVNMADVVTVERIILGLSPRIADANAKWDSNSDGSMNIDMADAIRIEKIILTGN